MLNTDPIGYMRAKAEREQAMQILHQLQGRQGQSEAAMTREQQQSEVAAINAEKAALIEKFPDLGTQEGFEKFRNEALTFGAKHYGLTETEISSIRSTKEIAVLRDAIAYRKLQSEKMAAVSAAKKTPVMTRPGNRERAPANSMEKLRSLGRPATAAEIFTAFED